MARLRLAFALAALLLLSGCMTMKQMPLGADGQGPDLKADSLVLLSAKITNNFSPRYQPRIITAVIEPEGATEASHLLSFTPKEPFAESEEGVKEYLLSANLAPGNYTMKEIRCLASAFPFHGSCSIPMNVKLSIERTGEIIYLGHVNASIREKADHEFAAGPLLPLIDQSVTGMSNGTFDVNVEDLYALDEDRYRRTYPVIAGIPMRKALMPAWVRPAEDPAPEAGSK